MKYSFWVNYKAMATFEPHIGYILSVIDLKNVGRKNFSLAQLKKCYPEIGLNFPEVSPLAIFVRPGWVVSTLFSMCKPFLHKNTLKKLVFVKEKEMTRTLLNYIPEENLPEEYGGTDTDFAELNS